jgi:hypothetical protein
MEIHQILIRPNDHKVFILYLDAAGLRNNTVFDSTGNAAIDSAVAECRQRLPSDTANPNRAQIERQIAELQSRLTTLRQSIGQA